MKPSTIVLLAGLMLAPSVHAQQLPLPPSEGSLSCRGVDEYLESFRVRRLLFTGDLDFKGDPPREFYAAVRPENGAALQFQHIYDSDTRVQFWIYRNAGPTEFNAQTWNRNLVTLLDTLPTKYTATIEVPFEEGENTGPPMLGYISLTSMTTIADQKSGRTSYIRVCMVPVQGSDKVVVLTLHTKEKHLAYMNPLFEAFVRGLHLMGDTFGQEA